MSTDFVLGAYAGIKALILADTWLANANGEPNGANGVRKFIWYDEADATPDRKVIKQPDRLAEITLDWLTMNDDGRTTTRTLGNAHDSTAPYIGTQQHEFEIVIVNDDTRITPISAITTHLLDAVKSGATISVGSGGTGRLGKVAARSEITSQGPAAGHIRRVVRIRVPMTVVYQGP